LRELPPSGSHRPLAGVRVVTLEQAVAAPLCSRHLADLGADVIKIERPDGGDFTREYDTAVGGLSANFVWLNRGKRSVCLDLKTPAGSAALWKLVASADVFIQNLGPGAIQRLGFEWDAVQGVNPRLIWCSISGYGLDGPLRDKKGFDLLLQGEAGIMAVTGSEDSPAKVGISIADNCAAIYAFGAILTLLYERAITGQGGRADISMFDCLAEWMSYPALLELSGRPPRRSGARHAGIVPYGPYRCGDSRQVNLAVQNEGQWRRLAEALDRLEWLDDPRFRTVESRTAFRDVLEPELEDALSSWSSDEAIARLTAADIPVGFVNDLASFVRHPELTERGRWVSCEIPGGQAQVIEHPLNLLGLQRRPGRVPALGEHTDEVLEELGGKTG